MHGVAQVSKIELKKALAENKCSIFYQGPILYLILGYLVEAVNIRIYQRFAVINTILSRFSLQLRHSATDF